MQERRAERVGEAERGPVSRVAVHVKQRLPYLGAYVRGLREGRVEGDGGVDVLGLEQAFVHDDRQVPVVQRYPVEPAVPVLQDVEQARRDRARDVPADQVAQVPLPGHEAYDRRGPLVLGRLDQLGDLLRFLANLVRIADVCGEP